MHTAINTPQQSLSYSWKSLGNWRNKTNSESKKIIVKGSKRKGEILWKNLSADCNYYQKIQNETTKQKNNTSKIQKRKKRILSSIPTKKKHTHTLTNRYKQDKMSFLNEYVSGCVNV